MVKKPLSCSSSGGYSSVAILILPASSYVLMKPIYRLSAVVGLSVKEMKGEKRKKERKKEREKKKGMVHKY